MADRRSRLRVRRGSLMESEDEDQQDRRHLRERRRLRYAEDNDKGDEVDTKEKDDSDQDNEEDSDAGGDDEVYVNTQDNEQDHVIFETGFWLVTCGAKTGRMDIEKLKTGKKCIEFEGRWLRPAAFEVLGGKRTAKKWKTSICSHNKPLQFWFERGDLWTTGYKRNKKKSFTSREKKEEEEKELFEDSDTDSLDQSGCGEDQADGSTDEEEVTKHGRGAEKAPAHEANDSGEDDLSAAGGVRTPRRHTHEFIIVPAATSCASLTEADMKLAAEAKVVVERLPPTTCSFSQKDEAVSGSDEDTINSSSTVSDLLEYSTNTLSKWSACAADNMAAPNDNEETRHRLESSPPSFIGVASSSPLRGTLTDQRPSPNETEDAAWVGAQSSESHSARTLPYRATSLHKAETPDLDRMDLKQLQRYRIKQQLKVLQIKEEYYTLKLNEFRRRISNAT